MSNIHLDTKHQVYWLSYEFLRGKDIPEDSFMNWSKRKICKRKYIDGRAFINYDTIPEPTRAKLPTKDQLKEEYSRQKSEHLEQWYAERLKAAYRSDQVPVWVNAIQSDETYSKLKSKQVTYFARRAAVIEKAVDLHETYNTKGCLVGLFYAYSRIYPDDYSKKNRFCMALKRAKEEGVLSVAVDKRSLREFKPKYTAVHEFFAETILSDPRAFDLVDSHEMLCTSCNELGIEVPSFWWLRQYYRKNRNYIDLKRHGKTEYEKEHRPYAKIIPALNRNTQWQMDGWEIPIYAKRKREDGSWELYFKYVLFAVIDAHSRKYVGYSIGESENTEVILQALEDAVKNTGVLPYEIVADNHSFNKTQEAKHFKAALDAIGVHWTVDSNPRRKAILERSFRTLGEKHFKHYYGYIGQGVRSKMKGGRTQQELIDEYTKNQSRFPVYEQIVATAVTVVHEYNEKIKPSLKQSPNERYEISEPTKCFTVDLFKRLQLFGRKSERRISKGQITINRGLHEYTYQLPSQFMAQYNGKMVTIRYADFDEISLFDHETDAPICCIPQKFEIHGSIGDQAEKDTKNLYKNSGRMKGNASKQQKRKDSIFNRSDVINPNAAEAMNKVKIPKDAIKQAEQNKVIREKIENKGVAIEAIPDMPVICMLKLDKPEKKENKHPFMPKGEVKMGKIKIDDWK